MHDTHVLAYVAMFITKHYFPDMSEISTMVGKKIRTLFPPLPCFFNNPPHFFLIIKGIKL